MFSPMRLWRILWKWVAPCVGLAAIGGAVFFYFHSPRQESYNLSATAGSELGMRHQLAERLRADLSQRKITVELHPSVGSEQALDWVESRKVDIALVQGGLSSSHRPNVRQVAALHVEPLHLLVKKELFRDASASLTALRGKTVDLDEVGSGTHSLSSAVMDFAGLRPKEEDPAGGYIPMSMDRKHLLAQQDPARLPDAIFLVASLPAPTVTALVSKHGYRLVPLPFAEAFALQSLAQPAEDASASAKEEHVVRGRVQAVAIPPFTYGLEPAVPQTALPTLGTRLLLVVFGWRPATLGSSPHYQTLHALVMDSAIAIDYT
jgi:TRAP-type uncharacterized transport system substrate-binding protein